MEDFIFMIFELIIYVVLVAIVFGIAAGVLLFLNSVFGTPLTIAIVVVAIIAYIVAV